MMNVWEYKCHKTVPWGEVSDHYLVEKTILGSSVEAILAAPIVYSFIEVTLSRVYDHLERHAEKRQQFKTLYSTLFPFIEEAQTFVGPRYPWIKRTKVSQKDLKAIGYHLNGLVYAICCFVKRKPSVRVTRDKIDFSKPLLCSGGPIPNWYTRNVMYGGEVDLPYRFKLDVTDELRETPPDKLREAGIKVGQREPPWLIADRRGKLLKIDGREVKPEFSGNKCIEDYFMIVKVRNIHPDATNTSCLILAGCHGSGTSAAGLALKNLNILEKIDKRVGTSYFQAIGRASFKNGRPLNETIRLVDIVSLS